MALCCYSVPSFASETGGKVFLDLQEDTDLEERNFFALYNEFINEVNIFDEKYPQQKIKDDFSWDLEDLHPDYTDQEISFRHKAIRYAVQGKRWYNFLKNKLQQVLTENDIPLQFADEQYELAQKEKYQDSNEPKVIMDFKKVISYSNLPQDKKAVEDKIYRDAGLITPYERKQILKKAFLERDWKTFFSYSLFNKNVFDKQQGIGSWVGPENVAIRISSATESVAGQSKISGLAEIYLNKNYFMLRYPFMQFSGSKLNFNSSQNVKNVSFVWPVPIRKTIEAQQTFSGYANIIKIPFTAEVINPDKNVSLVATLDASICKDNSCVKENITTNLDLEAGGENKETDIAQEIKLLERFIPKNKHPKITINHLFAYKKDQQSFLVLDVTSKMPVENINVFIENDDNIEFMPQYIVHDKNNLRIYLSSPLNSEELIGKQVQVLFAIDSHNAIYQKITIEKQPLNAKEASQFNVIALLWAFWGGLVLNFMPAVFPLWLLKLKSFYGFGRTTEEKTRRELIGNIGGILFVFLIIYASIAGFKSAGNDIRYYDIFQNCAFLCISIFLIFMVKMYIYGFIKTPQTLSENIKNYGFGIIITWAALAYNIPLFAQILEYTIVNNSGQLAVVMAAIFAGFITPNVILILFPAIALCIPYPNKWLKGVDKLANLLLWGALGWLLIVLTAQTNGNLWWHWALFLIGVWGILSYRYYAIIHLYGIETDPVIRNKVSRFFNIVAAVLLLSIFIGAYADTKYAQNKNLVENHYQYKYLSNIDMPYINRFTKIGVNVLVRINADWCIKCHYNDFIFNYSDKIQALINNSDMAQLNINIAHNPTTAQNIMHQFNIYDVPLYVLFTPQMPSGFVLPKITDEKQLYNFLKNQLQAE